MARTTHRKRFPVFLWGIFDKNSSGFGGALLQSGRLLKCVYESEGLRPADVSPADFDYYEEVWLNYMNVCPYLIYELTPI